MAEKKATREGFGAALAELGEKYDFLVLDADLAAATKTGMFKKKFPERFFDCGIAEGNMIGVAAGIAATGKKVFAASFSQWIPSNNIATREYLAELFSARVILLMKLSCAVC